MLKKSYILSLGLIIVAGMQAMDQSSLIQADLLIHADNKIRFIDHDLENVFNEWGIRKPSDSMLVVKIEAFAQDQYGDDLNFTKGEVPGQPAFPCYIPLDMVWGLDSDSTVTFTKMKNEVPVTIKFYLRDNFAVNQSLQEQINDALDKHEHNLRNQHSRTEC